MALRAWLLITVACLVLGLPCLAERLGYHEIQTDASGKIVPWCSLDPGQAYDQVIRSVWEFWNHMGNCPNGLPYFFQHQVWKPEHDPRGLGGDQLAMALSSLNLLYAYLGDPAVRDMMCRIADYSIERGFSRPHDAWPNLPYPYDTDLHSGSYDGDMRAGKGFLQPDKAGSHGIELLTLYEMTGKERYLAAATGIADTLSARVAPGDADRSPWPFRVNAQTGELAKRAYTLYTANWTGTLRLFAELKRLKRGNTRSYDRAFQLASSWLRQYPLASNKWGPFFEDITDWSNTEINGDTMAWYLLENPGWDRHWQRLARGILDWSFFTFATNGWARYGVTPIQEQTAYRVPGNSHTSRHASVQLLYCEKSGDFSGKEAAVRQLNWATYMVDADGKNRYPNDDIWLTDGYGDYLRHYLRAMAAVPELAPVGQNHLLRSSSVIQQIDYQPDSISYVTFDAASRDRLRVASEPMNVTAAGKNLRRVSKLKDLEKRDGFYYDPGGPARGWLEIRHSKRGPVVVRLLQFHHD